MNRLYAALTMLLLGLLLAGAAVAHDTVYYYSSDTVRSEVVITDANRNVVERTNYAPYGQVLNRSLRDGPGYTGHEEDPESSLVYMQQRYYDPQSGRFLSNDPVATTDDGGNFNRYAYVGNDPMDRIDPTGDDAACVYAGDCQTFLNINNVPGNLQTTGEIAGAVGLAAATDGIGELAEGGSILSKIGQVVSGIRRLFGAAEEAKTITRYMGKTEAETAARTGEIPNVGLDGQPRPTHVTTDAPTDSASEAKQKYELPEAPTHRATVPANRVSDLGPTPDGRSTTRGGGSQKATNQPIQVNPCEISELCK
jgi:RHS repeat-associated protein